jgi:hypothetical protein
VTVLSAKSKSNPSRETIRSRRAAATTPPLLTKTESSGESRLHPNSFLSTMAAGQRESDRRPEPAKLGKSRVPAAVYESLAGEFLANVLGYLTHCMWKMWKSWS